MEKQKTLAWHETLEIHELTAFKSVGLMKLKQGIKHITDHRLRSIYQRKINVLESGLRELLELYPAAPKPGDSSEYRVDHAFYAGDLLAFSKAEVRNTAIALTETATPYLREMLTRHLNDAIKGHGEIFRYMYDHGLYPYYHLRELLQNDVQLAQKALSM